MALLPVRVPLRLRVLRTLCESLHGIEYVADDGKLREIKTNVFRGRVVFGESDPIPMLSVLEAPQQDAGNFAGPAGKAVKQPWELVLQAFVTNDPKNPTDPGHFLLAEVKDRLIRERSRINPVTRQVDILGMGGVVDQLTFDAGVVRPPDETSAVAHFWLTIYLVLVEDLTKPYA